MIDFFAALAACVIMIAVAAALIIVIPFIRDTVIPWLEEKRMYGLVSKFVEAAEKMADTGVIEKEDKNKYVIGLLENLDVEITPEINAFIESAVNKLDRAFASVWSGVLEEFGDLFDDEEEGVEDDELPVEEAAEPEEGEADA